MRRSLVVAATVFCAVFAGCQTVKNTYNDWFGPSAKPVKPAELSPFNATTTPRIVWQGSVGAADKTVLFPVAAGNTIYAAGASGQITAFSGNTGAVVTRFEAGQRISGGVGASATLAVVGTTRGELLVFDHAGKPVWKAQLPGEMLAPPAVEADLVVARAGDGALFAFEALSGKRRWVYQRSTPSLSVRGYAGVVVNRGVVYAGFPGGRLIALSAANGGVIWDSVVALPRGATELERVADVTSPPVIDEARVCAVAYQGRVACFDPQRGTGIWARDVSSFAGLAADNRNLYITDDKNAVIALDKTSGGSVWKQDKLFGRSLTRPLALGRYVIVGDFQGYVHLLSRDDGSFAARIATDGSAIAAVPVALDLSSFLVQTRNGGVYAISVQ